MERFLLSLVVSRLESLLVKVQWQSKSPNWDDFSSSNLPLLRLLLLRWTLDSGNPSRVPLSETGDFLCREIPSFPVPTDLPRTLLPTPNKVSLMPFVGVSNRKGLYKQDLYIVQNRLRTEGGVDTLSKRYWWTPNTSVVGKQRRRSFFFEISLDTTQDNPRNLLGVYVEPKGLYLSHP